ncbi:hypothetical protein D9M70_540620 [compost metagenome]
MSFGGTLNQLRLPTIFASSSLFAMSSHHCAASWIAMVSALAARGFFSTQSARMAKDFSGCSFQISAVLTAV